MCVCVCVNVGVRRSVSDLVCVCVCVYVCEGICVAARVMGVWLAGERGVRGGRERDRRGVPSIPERRPIDPDA